MNFERFFGDHKGGFFGGRHGGFGRGFGHGFGGFMGGGRGMRAARMLASGDLQLVVLSLLKEKPRHGYELIKELETKSSGFYVPSPGVIYPALTYLEEAEFATSETEGNKKRYQITEAGLKHLEENGAVVSEILQHLTLLGMKMAKMRKHFAEEEAETEFEKNSPHAKRAEWRKLHEEFHAIRGELKAALFEKIDAAEDEKKRILGILKKAIAEIREK